MVRVRVRISVSYIMTIWRWEEFSRWSGETNFPRHRLCKLRSIVYIHNRYLAGSLGCIAVYLHNSQQTGQHKFSSHIFCSGVVNQASIGGGSVSCIFSDGGDYGLLKILITLLKFPHI